MVRGHERPPDEVNGVIKAELALAILDVMVGEKLVELLGLFVIGKIDTAPFVTRGKVISCLLNIGHCLDFNRLVEGGLGVHLVILRDRLGVPEVVLIEERDCLSDLLEIPLVVILLALVLKFLEESENIGSQSSLLSQVFVEKHRLKLMFFWVDFEDIECRGVEAFIVLLLTSTLRHTSINTNACDGQVVAEVIHRAFQCDLFKLIDNLILCEFLSDRTVKQELV